MIQTCKCKLYNLVCELKMVIGKTQRVIYIVTQTRYISYLKLNFEISHLIPLVLGYETSLIHPSTTRKLNRGMKDKDGSKHNSRKYNRRVSCQQ